MDPHNFSTKPVGKSQTFPKGTQLLNPNNNIMSNQMLNQNQMNNFQDAFSSSGHSSTNDLTNSLQSLQFQSNNNNNSSSSRSINNIHPPHNNNIQQNNNNHFNQQQRQPGHALSAQHLSHQPQQQPQIPHRSQSHQPHRNFGAPQLATATSTGNIGVVSNNDAIAKSQMLLLGSGPMSKPKRPDLKKINFGAQKKPTGVPFKKGHNKSNSWHASVQSDLKDLDKMKGVIDIPGIPRQKIKCSDLESMGFLGKGTQGEVHKMKFTCQQGSNQVKLVAVKKMIKNGVQEELKRILQDNKTSHKSRTFDNIAKWFGVIAEEQEIWIIMEFCEFGDFQHVAQRYKLKCKQTGHNKCIPEFVISEFTLSVTKALHYLKETLKIIHRDIRPSNILVDHMGEVKLCDFGISGNLQDSKVYTQAAGVATYLAPERVKASTEDNNQGYDVRSDVFALGITVYELSAGVHPFAKCQCALSVGMEIMRPEPIKFPDSAAAQFSPEFLSFLAKCLVKQVADRWRYPQMLNHPFLTKVQALNSPSATQKKNTNRMRVWLHQLFDKPVPKEALTINDTTKPLSTSCNNLQEPQNSSPSSNLLGAPKFQERRNTIQPVVPAGAIQTPINTPPVPPRSTGKPINSKMAGWQTFD